MDEITNEPITGPALAVLKEKNMPDGAAPSGVIYAYSSFFDSRPSQRLGNRGERRRFATVRADNDKAAVTERSKTAGDLSSEPSSHLRLTATAAALRQSGQQNILMQLATSSCRCAIDSVLNRRTFRPRTTRKYI